MTNHWLAIDFAYDGTLSGDRLHTGFYFFYFIYYYFILFYFIFYFILFYFFAS